jgi:aminopeptidase N
MATYLATVAVGRYERIDAVSPAGIPLRHYTFAESRAALEPTAAVTAEAIDWMSDLFGPYPYEAFGFVIARVPGGSLETQTMVLLSDSMIGARTAVHELAHQWFGNWVSLDSWSEMWRNEGFATYVTYLWLTRDNPAQLETEMAQVRGAVDNNDQHYPLDYPPAEYLFEYDVYFEGALAVHALRQEVGDEAFFGGLRAYLERFGGGAASDEQFQAVIEEAAGRPLQSFFDQWFPAP